jgi:hypothetical protein
MQYIQIKSIQCIATKQMTQTKSIEHVSSLSLSISWNAGMRHLADNQASLCKSDCISESLTNITIPN